MTLLLMDIVVHTIFRLRAPFIDHKKNFLQYKGEVIIMLLQSIAAIVDYFCNCDYLEILKFASEFSPGTIKSVTL